MLAEVRVRDLALLEQVEVVLSPGLNVVSGETGEGKSLLLRAITLLLGARAQKGLVRKGRAEAVMEGRFLLDAASRDRVRACCELIEEDASEVCLRRVVSAAGSSRAYVDGSMVPAGVLARVGGELVDIHGQTDHLSLRRGREQGRALDRYGGLEAAASQYAQTYRELEGVLSRLQNTEAEEVARRDRRDLLRFQLTELEDLSPRVGEETESRRELQLLERGVELGEALHTAAWKLGEQDGAVVETLRSIERSMGQVVPDDPTFTAIVARAESLRLEAEDLAADCARLEAGLEKDPHRKDEIASRLDRLRSLSDRHSVAGDELGTFAETLAAELAVIENPAGVAEELESTSQELRDQLRKLGKTLGSSRQRAARRLEAEIADGLAELRMPDARFSVKPGPKLSAGTDPQELGEEGPGAGRFLVAANPGEELQPMEKVASGGETARILLALRGALAGHHRIPLLIFDEIDSGVGSRIGLSFGRRIASIAHHHQVLVVTHLPQVAAWAETHLRVVKSVSAGRTRTEVRVLARRDRVEELADMLGGEIAPAAARAQALALLEEAGS